MMNQVIIRGGNTSSIPVVRTNVGRQPVIVQQGTGLNAGNVPKANVKHITNSLQRKPR